MPNGSYYKETSEKLEESYKIWVCLIGEKGKYLINIAKEGFSQGNRENYKKKSLK